MTIKAYCCLINRSHRLYLRAIEMLSKYVIVRTDCGHCSSVFATIKSTLVGVMGMKMPVMRVMVEMMKGILLRLERNVGS